METLTKKRETEVIKCMYTNDLQSYKGLTAPKDTFKFHISIRKRIHGHIQRVFIP